MNRLLTINELCKLTLVSIRTLHYYDEINLLTPSHRTPQGRRLYSEDDVLKLQQIVTLKFMGFSLAQIKRQLQENKFNIVESLKMQAHVLAEEAARIEKVANFTQYLIDRHESNHAVDWKMIAKIIEVLKLKEVDRQQWYEKYITEIELKQFKKFAKAQHHEQWKALFKEIRQYLHSDPESEIGQKLVKKWFDLANEAYADYPGLMNKLWEGYKAGIIPQDYFPYDKEVIAYLTKAEKYLHQTPSHPTKNTEGTGIIDFSKF